MKRHSFICPHCGQRISMLLDLSAGSQRYVEDCEACCSAVEIRFQVEAGCLVFFDATIP